MRSKSTEFQIMKNIKRIATLGPPGTFSDAATAKYGATLDGPYKVEYFSSIKNVLQAIGSSCEIGVVPIENFSEGFIPLVLDQLVEADLVIVGEVMLPIQFSFASKARELSDVDQLFVQYVAKGQCAEFIQSLGSVKVVTTESNIESLERVRCASGASAAIVPSSAITPDDFQTVVENVNDYKINQTRFLALSSGKTTSESAGEGDYKTSLVVLDDHDRPGLLGDVLASFSKRKINLTSIISRPTCREFGKYHFFIELDGSVQDPVIFDALEEIRKINKVKFLGSYLKGK
jgi:prephenate dehydratase